MAGPAGEGGLDRGEAALEAGRPDEALAVAEALLAKGEDRHPVHTLRIRALQACGRVGDALLAAADAVDRHPRAPGLRVQSGKLLLASGDDARALAAFEIAVAQDPLQLEGWKGILTLRPVDPAEEGLDRVAALTDDPARSARQRAKAGFVLGQILSEAGRHDEGFARYAAANATLAEGADPAALEYRFSPAAFAFDRALFARHPAQAAAGECPAILVAGLPRSGKTLTEGLLAAAPDVQAGGELALLARFGRLLDWSGGAEAVAATLAAQPSPLIAPYRAEARGARHVTDTGPTNLSRLGLMGLLHPDVPAILCRRDPLDLGASMFFKQFRRGNLFTTALPPLGRAIARAERLIDHWRAHLPGPVMVLDYEEMVADPESTTARLATLTGLSLPPPAPRAPQAMRLTPGRSLGRDGIGTDLLGFATPFAGHLAPMMAAYHQERDRLAK